MQFTHSDLQDQLVRGLSHRMNNILTLFHGYVGLLMENKDLDKATRDGLGKIQLGASQASELMDRTQALVRPSASVLRAIDLAEYLRFIRPAFDQFRGPRTTINMQLDDDVPRVQGDASRIKTTLIELVKNACEATFDGGTVNIELRSEAVAGQRQKWAVVSITDDGPGIPPEISEKIFSPFYTTKKKQNAAGLGLTLAASFAQLHQGSIKISSEPKKTVVDLRLPAMTT
jgi:signal transduction histidine kinase